MNSFPSQAPIDRVLDAFRARGEVRDTASGWTTRCPAHDDQNPSLSISTGDDARVLLCCHAGCDNSAICAEVGLQLADLFSSGDHQRVNVNGTSRSPGNRGVSQTETKTSRGKSFTTADEAIAVWEPPQTRPVEEDVDDEDAPLLPSRSASDWGTV